MSAILPPTMGILPPTMGFKSGLFLPVWGFREWFLRCVNRIDAIPNTGIPYSIQTNRIERGSRTGPVYTGQGRNPALRAPRGLTALYCTVVPTLLMCQKLLEKALL